MNRPRQSQRPALNQQQDASPLVVARSQLISTRNATTAVTTSNTGRWETRERLAFLRGLRLYGRGNWKQISKMISTRYVHHARYFCCLLMSLMQGSRFMRFFSFLPLQNYDSSQVACSGCTQKDGSRSRRVCRVGST